MATTVADPEKGQKEQTTQALSIDDVVTGRNTKIEKSTWGRFKSSLFEYRGIHPIAVEDRTDRRYINVFTLWVSMSLSVLPYVP